MVSAPSGNDHAPRNAAVIGWPITHSLSPLIHRIWAMREGAPASYVPVAAPPGADAFSRVADGLAAAGFRGANVTIPHKENAFRYAARATDRARRAGAANMLTFTAAGAIADNSDIAGFAEACRAAAADAPRRAVMIGAGGAARGVALALEALGANEILIGNRTQARAQQLIDDLGLANARAVSIAEADAAAATADLIVNASSLGMRGEPALPIDASRAPDNAIIADIVYAPLETPLLQSARMRGLRTVDGLEMLMRQAVFAYEAWLGVRADVDADLRNQLVAALSRRGA
jgi:shikimate dehydrogenase